MSIPYGTAVLTIYIVLNMEKVTSSPQNPRADIDLEAEFFILERG